MNFLKHKHAWFAGPGIFLFLLFFCFRPLNSPSYRIIVADGLGYYAYLPAKFIYHDTALEFKWFDEVFNANYEDHLFEKPTQNFMVRYHDRMINLYYPGQSLLQLPFFFAAHASAHLFNYPPDGFSFPYQLWMGIAGIFYTLLGLFFCNKLLFRLSQNRRLSIYITLLVFFATNLFTYSIFAGCYTHCYSFAFITLSLYFAQAFFQTENNKLRNGLLLLTSAVVVVFLRPVNCLLLVSVFYFWRSAAFKELLQEKANKIALLPVIFILLVVIGYNFSTTYTQTHALIANTYTIGKFYFNDWSHLWANLVGFQNGILWYTPLIMLGFVPLFFCRREPRLLLLVLPVLGMILLYSFWFYWNIVNRTLVDFTGILALLLLWLFMHFNTKTRAFKTLLVITFLCVPFYQLKAYQLRNGIISSSYTYWKYYVKYFFTLRHVDVFPVDPGTVINKQEYFYDFEQETSGDVSKEQPYAGERSAKVDYTSPFGCSKTFTLPAFFEAKGFKKLKSSFWFYRQQGADDIQLVFSFKRNDSVVSAHTFYINKSTTADSWQYKEFGMDFDKGVAASQVVVYFWNASKPDKAYIDDFKMEFILKNGSDEITLDN